MTPRWAIFISGRGSNLQALLDTLEQNRITLVVSSSSRAPGILKAKRAGIPVLVLDKKINWQNLHIYLKKRSIDFIFLAGFMKLVPSEFIQNWQDKILNVHPSLLPAFPGLNAIKNSFDAGGALGVTVHIVTPEMDAGPILLKKEAVPLSKRLAKALKLLTFSEAEFLISITEQRLVREAVTKWN